MILDARNKLHAGCSEDRRRIILIAFTTLHISNMGLVNRWLLGEQGFPVPNSTDVQNYLHSSLHEVRLRQRTLTECLALPVDRRDKFDVIEIISEDVESDVEEV